MHDLLDTTFISVVKIESEDRYKNAKSVLGFLNHHFRTNVLIYEMTKGSLKTLDFLDDLGNLKIRVVENNTNDIFHRTKYLNHLLGMVETKVTCNYDIDVIFPVRSYLLCESLILFGEAEIIYPFPREKLVQTIVHQNFDRKKFHLNFDPEELNNAEEKRPTYCGHAVFLNTSSYKKYGGENERFISYGPEDRERLVRFEKLGAEILNLEDGCVYHFEHFRGQDSGKDPLTLERNEEEYALVKEMSAEEIRKYQPPIKD